MNRFDQLFNPQEIQKRAIQKQSRNVLLLVDTSGSMDEGEAENVKIEQAKRGASDYASSVNTDGYSTALAIFGDRAAMVCNLTVDTGEFTRKISGLRTGLVGGSTDLTAGLVLANKFSELKAVVIVTDGQPNNKETALRAADVIKARGITIVCIGTDDADMKFLAKLGRTIHCEAKNLQATLAQASRLLLRE